MNEIENEELDEETLNYVLGFAEAYNIYGNALTPFLLNQRLKEMNVFPVQPTESTLNQAMLNPRDSELILQEFSQSFEIQSQVYKKLLEYLGTILSFDMTYECINAKREDYKSDAYNKDLDRFKKFVDSFDYRQEFGKVVQELLRNEAYFGCPRLDNDRIVLQELPNSVDYTLISGRWSYGLLFSMNMFYFLLPGIDLNLFPNFFKQKFNEIIQGNKGLTNYNPALMPELRGKSSYVYWQDVPVDVGWCFKFNPLIGARLPYLSGLFLDLIQQPLMRALQKNVNMAAASRQIIGEIPLLNKTSQAGGVKDQFSISAKNLGHFLAIVKEAIGDAVKTAAVPLQNVQGIEFKAENDIYSSFLRTSLASAGINTNLLFTNDVRPNSIESQLSLNVDENQMYDLYPQFERFMEYQINKLTKKFKFRIHFEGSSFYNNRQMRFDNSMTLTDKGIVLPHKIGASIGLNPFEFQRQLEEAQSTGWVDKLTPIISAFQQSGKDSGRPETPDGKISDAGENTRSTGGNVEKTQS